MNTSITLKRINKPRRKKLKEEKNYKNNEKTSSKMAISTFLSKITLNVNRLYALIKRHRWFSSVQSLSRVQLFATP